MPDGAARTLISHLFGVPVSAWDRPEVLDGVDDEEDPSGIPGDPDGIPDEPEDDDESDPEIDPLPARRVHRRKESRERAATLAMVDALVGQLERELRGKLTSQARARTSDSLTRALSTRARIEREAATFESEVIRRAPFYARMRKALISALVPFPDAARAVARVFTEIDDKDDGAQQGALDEEDDET